MDVEERATVDPVGTRGTITRDRQRDLPATVSVRHSLVDFLREDLGLTGTHLGCEHGVCGACTVLFDGEPVRACLMLAVQADGAEITTVEGLAAADEDLHPVQQAFWDHHGLQCGFCTPGILLTDARLPAREHRAHRRRRSTRRSRATSAAAPATEDRRGGRRPPTRRGSADMSVDDGRRPREAHGGPAAAARRGRLRRRHQAPRDAAHGRAAQPARARPDPRRRHRAAALADPRCSTCSPPPTSGPDLPSSRLHPRRGDLAPSPQYPLARDKVRYVGEPVAVIVAEARYDRRGRLRAHRGRLRVLARGGRRRSPRSSPAHRAARHSRTTSAAPSTTPTATPTAPSPRPTGSSASASTCSATPACRWRPAASSPHRDAVTGEITIWASTQWPHILREHRWPACSACRDDRSG